jgi:multidrug efflux pump
MVLSDLSITRPVFATVLSLLLIAFGLVSYYKLPLREFPDIDPPVVTVQVGYPGASADIVETRITQIIEERIAGVEGIRFISSSSRDGESTVTLEFDISRDIEAAANDVRDRVSGILDNLPEEADPPEVQKADSSDDVIVWFNLESDRMSVEELSDFTDRYLVDRFSVLDGVARIRIGGQRSYAMRIWIDRNELAARNLTVNDIEEALRAENVELPAGDIESRDMQFVARVERAFRSPEDFNNLVLAKGEDGYLIRLGDVARVEKGLEEDRTIFRGNGKSMIGIGIIKQSKANTIDVADAAAAEVKKINENLPDGMIIKESYDTSVFIRAAIHEVYMTLIIAIGLVIIVIYGFLGSWRATIVPTVAVPVSIIATFIVLYAFDYSVNMLTLLALVLAIGIVVDDAIVVLENIERRIRTLGETPLVAAYYGTRQVGFAIIATTLVLMAVFIPLVFLEGDVGRLFTEFAVAMAASVAFSGFAALTISPMLASRLLKKSEGEDDPRIIKILNSAFDRLQRVYERSLRRSLKMPLMFIALFFGLMGGTFFLYQNIPSEYVPREDRGAFFISINGPEGASFSYMEEYMNEIERRLMPYVENGDFTRLLVRAPRGFGPVASFNSGFIIVVLKDWKERGSGFDIMNEVRGKLADLPGVTAFPVMRQAFGGSSSKPVEFVIGGGTYEELAKWRDILLEKIKENNPGLDGIDWDYKETKPQFQIDIDYDGAAELGVSVSNIGRTLETILGGRRITTYIEDGEEYDVIVEGERAKLRTPNNIENIFVRSERSGELIPLSNLITITERADSTTLNRFNRIRAITIEANLKDGYSLGEALTYLEGLVKENLPETARIDYKGQSQDFKYSSSSIIFVFVLGLAIVYLVLAAQFESFIHPLVIMLSVPLAMAGGLFGLYVMGATINIYTQIGLIVLIGIAAKNGILIVEFTNQLRDEGKEFTQALIEASSIRLRPILMTGITTGAGAVPLMLSFGAGAETRAAIGTVVFFGVVAATVFTIYIVPVAYSILARRTGSPGDIQRQLEQERKNSGTADI